MLYYVAYDFQAYTNDTFKEAATPIIIRSAINNLQGPANDPIWITAENPRRGNKNHLA